jgi:hypothetical protein
MLVALNGLRHHQSFWKMTVMWSDSELWTTWGVRTLWRMENGPALGYRKDEYSDWGSSEQTSVFGVGLDLPLGTRELWM